MILFLYNLLSSFFFKLITCVIYSELRSRAHTEPLNKTTAHESIFDPIGADSAESALPADTKESDECLGDDRKR